MILKIGDIVRVKSIQWYNKNKKYCVHGPGPYGFVVKNTTVNFTDHMSTYCGKIGIVVGYLPFGYDIQFEDESQYYRYVWTNDMLDLEKLIRKKKLEKIKKM